jgi:hypothetical protein
MKIITPLALAVLLVPGAIRLPADQEASLATESATPPANAVSDAGPLAVVAQFLNLRPEQVLATTLFLQDREQAIGPLRPEIARREQRLRELVASGGDPAEIGRLVMEIHGLRALVETAQASFLVRFESLLDQAQRRKWRQVRLAAQVSPVLPAFQILQML